MSYLRSFTALGTLTLLLTACGGSTSNGSNALQAPFLTGTAATTNLVIANSTVTLKDSTSPVRTITTTTDSQGHYSFTLNQVQGLSAPFMLETSYTVGGATFYLHSAVSTQDYASGSAIVNITPLTEAVVANVLGNSPQVEFNASGFSAITSASLTSGEQSLNALLQPLLPQLGITTTPDFIHQSFNVDGTGLDALINAVHVNIDPITNSEIITNALNGSSISGTLNLPPTTPISIAGSANLSTQQSVVTFLNGLATQFASNPTATTPALLAAFDQTNFMQNGVTLPTYLSGIISKTQVAGGSLAFTDIVLGSVPSYVTLPSGVTTAYNVTFTAVQNNKAIGRYSFVVYANGSSWLILGNQLKAQIDLRTFEGNNNNAICSGLQLNIADTGAFTTPISYATVSGPGLDSGLLFFQNGSSSTLALAATGATYTGTNTAPATGSCYSNIATLTDAQIGEINVANLPAVYTVTLYNVTGTTTTTLATYQPQILVPPLTTAQLTTTLFPSNITVSPSLSKANGGSVSVNWSSPIAITSTSAATAATATSASFNLLPDSVYLSITGTAGTAHTLTNVPLQQSTPLTVPLTAQVSATAPTTTSASSGNVTVSYLDSIFLTLWASPASAF